MTLHRFPDFSESRCVHFTVCMRGIGPPSWLPQGEARYARYGSGEGVAFVRIYRFDEPGHLHLEFAPSLDFLRGEAPRPKTRKSDIDSFLQELKPSKKLSISFSATLLAELKEINAPLRSLFEFSHSAGDLKFQQTAGDWKVRGPSPVYEFHWAVVSGDLLEFEIYTVRAHWPTDADPIGPPFALLSNFFDTLIRGRDSGE